MTRVPPPPGLAPGRGEPAVGGRQPIPHVREGRRTHVAGLGVAHDHVRDQARELGQAFEAASVTVGKVLHSRWCRARDTAELAFPGKVEPEPVLDSFFADRATREEQTEQLRRIVSQWSGPDALVLVTHQVNITALTDVFPREGEVIVLKPGDDGFDIAGRIAPVPAK